MREPVTTMSCALAGPDAGEASSPGCGAVVVGAAGSTACAKAGAANAIARALAVKRKPSAVSQTRCVASFFKAIIPSCCGSFIGVRAGCPQPVAIF
jgi:hypothetical protein